jgi:predicted ferric reductase
MLFGLSIFSIGPVRARFYNLFYRMHIPMWIAYLGLIFIHVTERHGSWPYLYATAGVWGVSIFGRFFIKWQTVRNLVRKNTGVKPLNGFPARMTPMSGGMTKLSILVPGGVRWKTGQHVWLRVPHLSWLQNHPYTIANVPRDSEPSETSHEMSFLIRAQRGLTLDLSKSANDECNVDRTVPIHVDGPYGGIPENVTADYDTVVLVAGGSGVAACIPWIQHIVAAQRAGAISVRDVRMLWTVRQAEHVEWIAEDMEAVNDALSETAPLKVGVDCYVTGSASMSEKGDGRGRSPMSGADMKQLEISEKSVNADNASSKAEKSSTFGSVSVPSLVRMHQGRPVLGNVMPSFLAGRRIMIIGKFFFSFSFSLSFRFPSQPTNMVYTATNR